MPFIKYPSQPETLGEGREARDAAVHPDTGVWVAEVDVALPGESVVDEKQHADVVAAAMADAETPKDSDPVIHAPSPFERLSWRVDEIVRLNGLKDSDDAPPPMEAKV